MIDKIKLQAELKHFTGSEQIFYNPLFPKFRYTEGVKYLAQETHCYWLLDYIFSNQHCEELLYIPERLTPLFRFGLTPSFRRFDPPKVSNVPEV